MPVAVKQSAPAMAHVAILAIRMVILASDVPALLNADASSSPDE
jgi:hypothetical protein